jgi:hypothetical protein
VTKTERVLGNTTVDRCPGRETTLAREEGRRVFVDQK